MQEPSGSQLSFFGNAPQPSAEKSAEVPSLPLPAPVEAQKPAKPVKLEFSEKVLLPSDPSSLAPMLRQYVEMKGTYQDHLLLYQVGDFYEVFYQDAITASEILNIRLTSRDKNNPDPTPMCGVPIHAIDNYLPKLLEAGQSVVLVSQVDEDRGKKGGVRREISRVITPGIRYEGDGLDERSFNFVSAAVFTHGAGALAYADISTGVFRVCECETHDELFETFERVRPAEVVVPSILFDTPLSKTEPWIKELRRRAEQASMHIVFRPMAEVSRSTFGERYNRFSVEQGAPEAFQGLGKEGAAAASALLDYVEEVSFGKLPRFHAIVLEERSRTVFLDSATRRNLEITETRLDRERKNSLLAHIDYTRTAMGGRHLKEWLLSPTADRELLERRYDAIDELRRSPEEQKAIRSYLTTVRDLERILSRVTSNLANPRDLAMLRDSIEGLTEVKAIIEKRENAFMEGLFLRFDTLDDIRSTLFNALEAEPPLRINEGGIFKEGYNSGLDEIRLLRTDGHSALLQLENKYRQQTGITSLKVRYNNIFGYSIEVSKTHDSKVPSTFERKQTLANAERYVTPELKEFEVKMLSAKGRQLELERELFLELRELVLKATKRIQRTAGVLAELDVISALTELAEKHHYVRPELVSANGEPFELKIVGGRHPVVERVLGEHNFVPNDLTMNGSNRRFSVLTGPNMGGKSTYLRQVGLIQLLAQAGSFVPAQSAKLPLVDRIFTRIGSADDLSRGDSTFMVEMKEAATIVRKATPRSLVLIDEIGRGTATADGLAIATAIAEWLHDVVKCPTIFATHFHELTQLAGHQEGTFCLAVGIVERESEIEFTHRIEERVADKSYGIEVARLAGLPERLLKRAEEILDRETTGEKVAALTKQVEKQQVVNAEEVLWAARLKDAVEVLRPDTMTPLEALVTLTRLKDQCRDQ